MSGGTEGGRGKSASTMLFLTVTSRILFLVLILILVFLVLVLVLVLLYPAVFETLASTSVQPSAEWPSATGDAPGATQAALSLHGH